MPADSHVDCPKANIWRVNDVVAALQAIAAQHRSQFSIPVVGITGSNGKTIVKDWLVQLLSPDGRLSASPKSYNSQIGVPLSVWQMSADDRMAIIEAGISEAGEMTRLQQVIKPTIGIFTNIGQAHDENFLTRQQKVAEKLQLFTHCDVLIYSTDHKDIHSVLSDIESFRHINRFTWGSAADNNVCLNAMHIENRHTRLTVTHDGSTFDIVIPFVDRASQENVMQCITLMLYLGYAPSVIADRCARLIPVEMRLEMIEGINNSLIINDSYSLDFNSLSIFTPRWPTSSVSAASRTSSASARRFATTRRPSPTCRRSTSFPPPTTSCSSSTSTPSKARPSCSKAPASSASRTSHNCCSANRTKPSWR